jgi:hypothetical protein
LLVSKKFLIGFLSALILTASIIVPGFGTNSQAHAASLKSQKGSSVQQKEETNKETKISNVDLQSLDQYVKVINNKYVLSIPSGATINSDVINAAQAAINGANLNVVSNDSIINPVTKEYNTNTNGDTKIANSLTMTALAKSLPAHETRDYWWGTRHIFRTQGAVDDFIYRLSLGGVATGLIALIPGGVAISGLTVAKITVVGLDLSHYKSKHKSSKIYMDINLTFHTSFGVWHD